ncbi:MAG: hypothetical protein DME97_15795 [Verrucomicrobia bacterium]|nr:MAG: hypothetical protein DME97_15795 [Verrucomicrobiota bacterium]
MIAQFASRQSSRLRTDSFWRICYGIALVFVFAWAVWQRFALPLDPIADPDTWGYLSPALRKLTGAEFGHSQARNFLYPGFLYFVLRCFGDFRAIAIVQHLLGMAAGGFLLLTWRRLRAFVPNPCVNPSLYDALGLVGTAIYLLASDTTRIETQLRPEGVCAFLISINLYFAVQFISYSFLLHRRAGAVVCASATVLTSLLLASAKPSFWFPAIVVMVPVAAFFLRQNWWRQKIALGFATALIASVVLWPEQILSREDEASQTFVPTMLFVIHADLIRDQMTEDLKENARLPYSREWLERVYTALNSEITKSRMKYPGHYALLNFDPEYLWFDPGSIVAQLSREFDNNLPARCAFFRFYYWRTWQRRPLRALQKVARQFSIYYFPNCPAYTPMKIWPLSEVYERAVNSLDLEEYRKIAPSLPILADFMQRTKSLAHNAPATKQAGLLRKALTDLAVSYLPIVLLTLILSAIIFLRPRWRRLRRLAVLVLFGWAYNAASCLEVAIVNSLEVHRYITVQMYATLLTQFVALWLILEFAVEIRQHNRAVV